MKRHAFIAGLAFASLTIYTSSCQKSSFDDFYRNPSKVTEVTVERQFSGMIYGFRQLIIPDYRNIFVTLRPTIFRYLHITGWINGANDLLPGGAAIEDRWSRYYEGLAQFRELETVYNNSPDIEKQEKRIFFLAAKVLFYDQTQQTVDLFGDIPWSQASMLSRNGGDYQKSYAPYDKAEDIYTAMLDDLKLIGTELNGISLSAGAQSSFNIQDIVNSGDVDLWRKYCNSLRLRMLARVSASPAFATRGSTEMAEIIGDPATYPIILTNAENIQIDIFNQDSDINTRGIRDAFEAGGWSANLASKAMVDHMLANADPRLPFLFEPGANASAVFHGLDQLAAKSAQELAETSGMVAIVNRSTISRNEYFPGILFSATETQLLLAEYHDKNGNTALAKTAFENAVKASVDLWQSIRAASNDNTVAAPADPTPAEIDAYLANLDWNGAANKRNLIAEQKWLHFNFVQTVQAWSEIRRFDHPTFSYNIPASDIQKTVPVKFNLPPSESVYNAANHAAVKAQDNVNTKLFWDVN